MTDRPATEPPTHILRCTMHDECDLDLRAAPRAVFDYLDREGVLTFADDSHRQRVIDGLGAAPRDYGLDVPAELRSILTEHGYQLQDTGEWWARSAGDWILRDIADLLARLSRPSNEREEDDWHHHIAPVPENWR